MLVSHIYASACNHQKQEASKSDGETAMIILGFLRCLCCLVKLGQCFHAFFPPLSVVYTNAGPWRVNNKGGGQGVAPNAINQVWSPYKTDSARRLSVMTPLSAAVPPPRVWNPQRRARGWNRHAPPPSPSLRSCLSISFKILNFFWLALMVCRSDSWKTGEQKTALQGLFSALWGNEGKVHFKKNIYIYFFFPLLHNLFQCIFKTSTSPLFAQSSSNFGNKGRLVMLCLCKENNATALHTFVMHQNLSSLLFFLT